jgi:hypothetical protein
MIKDYGTPHRQQFLKQCHHKPLTATVKKYLLRVFGVYFVYKVLSFGTCYAVVVLK